MESVGLSKSQFPQDTSIDIEKCVICQKSIHVKTTTGSDGRKRMLDASEIRNDHVTKRLKLVEREIFVYHMTNDCYKRYTMKSDLEKLQRKSEACPTPSVSGQDCTERMSTRINSRRNPPNPTAIRDVNCIICDNKSHKQVYTKYRISESKRALTFLAATNYFQDDVFSRTCDLQNPFSVFGADIFYHKVCMENYLYRYDTRSKETHPKFSDKQVAWNLIVPELEDGLKNGKGYELSAIREHLNSDKKCNFRNRDVKVFLVNQFGSGVQFTYPNDQRKSMMVFNVPKEVLAENIRSVDPVQVCASMIRDCLNDYDFGLEDSFCDAQDLKHACSDMTIPEPILRFFGHLFNFNPSTYSHVAQSVMAEESLFGTGDDEDSGDVEDIGDNEPKDNTISPQRCRKLQSLFQILFYVNHCGRKRTPMHILNAESVHSLGRGGKIVTTILNHEGLAISYAELRRYQHDLASFTAHHNEHQVGLPCHFDPGQFTSGAIDNWDHEGMNVSEHDTVTVLYQDKPRSSAQKPKVSETQVNHGPQAFKETLACQMLSEFHKSVRRPDIPTSFKVGEDAYSSAKATESNLKDTAWSLTRLDLVKNKVSVAPQSQTMPSWSASNSIWTEDNTQEKIVAFLPVLPYPVTEYATVYSAMKNFMAIGSQLVQQQIPMYCDEGVYCIVKEIQMMRQEEFKNLVPCLGTLHLVKTVLKCIGKALDGSGADIIWLQSGIFGPTIIQNSVLNGGHHRRALGGMQLLAEAIQRLLYKEFFSEKGVRHMIQCFLF